MTVGEMSFTSCGMPASIFKAFSVNAEEAPSNSDVRPVTIVPSGSSKAAAGCPVASALLQCCEHDRAVLRLQLQLAHQVLDFL